MSLAMLKEMDQRICLRILGQKQYCNDAPASIFAFPSGFVLFPKVKTTIKGRRFKGWRKIAQKAKGYSKIEFE